MIEQPHHRKHVFPYLPLDSIGWIPQHIGGVVGRHEGDTPEVVELSA